MSAPAGSIGTYGATRVRVAPYVFRILATAPFVLLYGVLFVGPVVALSSYATGGVHAWLRPLRSHVDVVILVRTIEISAEATALAVVLGYVYVMTLLAVSPRVRVMLIGTLLIPLFSNALVLSYAWIMLLGPSGPVAAALKSLSSASSPPILIYNRDGALLGLVQFLLPLFALTLYASVVRLPRDVMRAARMSGANRVQAFISVLLPLSMPGAVTGALLVFITAVGFYIVPAMLGGLGETMISQLIQQEFSQADFSDATILSYYLVAAVLVVLFVASRFLDVEGLVMQGASQLRTHRTRRFWSNAGFLMRIAGGGAAKRLGSVPWGLLGRAATCVIAAVTIAPVATLVCIAFDGDPILRFPPTSWSTRWWQAVLHDPEWSHAFLVSLIVGFVATAVSMVVSIPLAWSLVRNRWPSWARGGFVFISLVPFVLPVTALGLVMYLWFLSHHFLGNPFMLGCAHALLGVPFAFTVVLAGFGQIDRTYEHAARSLGASFVRTFRTVVMPLALPSLVVAAFLAFYASWTELVIAWDWTNSQTSTTLMVQMFVGTQQEVSPELAVVAVLTIVATLGGGLVAYVVQRMARARARGAGTTV